MTVEVVRIEAYGEQVTEAAYREQLEQALPAPPYDGEPRPGLVGRLPPDELEQAVREFARGLHVGVREYAVLSDGRRLLLTDDRGWTVSGPPVEQLWAGLTVEVLEQDVRNAVLPDDAEQTGDEHSWDLLAQRLVGLGVPARPEELRRVPYEVVLSDALRARLAEA